MGAIFPEDLGGAGFGYIEYSIIIEELARVDPSVALIVAAHNSLCTNHIYLAGSDEQRKKYIPKLATGEWIGCWSLTEPEAGSDAAGTRSTATLKDGEWVLNGGKTFTTNAQYADVCVAMAVTDRSASQHGISAFILEKGNARIPRWQEGKQARHASKRDRRSAVHRLPFAANATSWKTGRGICRQSTHSGWRPYFDSRSLDWNCSGRFRSGAKIFEAQKAVRPIHFRVPSIQHKLTDMATAIEAARLLTYCAGARKDAGKRVTKESAMAKLFASEMAVRVADQAVQIHGGYGFIKDYPVEKFYRDVKLCTIGEGTSEIQRLVIARQLLKE